MLRNVVTPSALRSAAVGSASRLLLPRSSGVIAPLFLSARAVPAYYHAGSNGRRTLSTSSILRNRLTDKVAHQEATTPHKQQLPGSSSHTTPPLSTPIARVGLNSVGDSVYTAPAGHGQIQAQADEALRGDWVLFHPVYTSSELQQVEVLHREAKTIPDKLAYGLVKFARKMFDFVSGYKHPKGNPPPGASLEELRKMGFALNEKEWLNRILFLESIAGVPGMVAATLRHLTSLRLMRRDSGWIHTCLEEAENERMHLMTFMTIRQPSIFFRAMVLGAQGVFYNLFFLSYMISPKICHRFVGYLEEEAVVTYTKCIKDLEAGMIPEWADLPAPEIAIDYWRLDPDAKMLDVIYAVRSDETTHRFVNHSLANLDPKKDVNPFALREPDMHVKGRKIAFERDESAQYVQESHELMTGRREQAN